MTPKEPSLPEALIGARRQLVATTSLLAAYTLVDLDLSKAASIPSTDVIVSIKNTSSVTFLMQAIVIYSLYRFIVETAAVSEIFAGSGIRRFDTLLIFALAWSGLTVSLLNEHFSTRLRMQAVGTGFYLGASAIMALFALRRLRLKVPNGYRRGLLLVLIYLSIAVVSITLADNSAQLPSFEYAASAFNSAFIFWLCPLAFIWLRRRIGLDDSKSQAAGNTSDISKPNA